MSGKARFLLGGCGALAPIVVNLLVVDLVAVFQELKLLVVAGYAVKVIILFVIGGMWAFMHKTEMEPLNVFQLGIVAPAVILSMNNGFNFRGKLEEGGGPQSADHVSALFTVPTAYAGLPGSVARREHHDRERNGGACQHEPAARSGACQRGRDLVGHPH